VKLGAKLLGFLAGLLLLYLLVGFLLPGRWEAQAEALLPTTPAGVFPLIQDPMAWSRWSPMPETGAERFGEERGVGAGLRWDDPRYGRGTMEIISAVQDQEVQYRVEVEGGSLQISGTLTLEQVPEGTRVEWRERGDFGWNPLLGYAALGMSRSQGTALKESLERLALLLSGPPTAP
jgi:hypothetical protein